MNPEKCVSTIQKQGHRNNRLYHSRFYVHAPQPFLAPHDQATKAVFCSVLRPRLAVKQFANRVRPLSYNSYIYATRMYNNNNCKKSK